MSKQPEALRLADSLELCWGDSRLNEAADELRRLHAENADLQRVLRLARAQLASHLQELADCHANPVTGLVDDQPVLLILESEQDLINQIDEALIGTTDKATKEDE